MVHRGDAIKNKIYILDIINIQKLKWKSQTFINLIIFWTQNWGLEILFIIQLRLVTLVHNPLTLFNPHRRKIFKLTFIKFSE